MAEGSSKTDEPLEHIAADQAEHIEALRKRIQFLEDREQKLMSELVEAKNDRPERDEGAHRAAHDTLHAQDRRLAELEDELRAANRVIGMMQSTRAWQLASSYWRVRTAAKRLFRRG